MKDVAFCIKAFKRPKSVERLVKSIKKFYPNAKIYIADDSPEPMKGSFAMEFDSGLSAGRNLLIRKTKEPYILILDDDFVFNKDTRIELLVKILKNNKNLGLVGGGLIEGGTIRHYEGYLKLENGILSVNKKKKKMGDYFETGMILNFFLARREMFDNVRWDSDLKLAEHTDFFLRLSHTKWKVGYCGDVIVEHKPAKTPDYKRYRCRGKHFMRLFMQKGGVKEIIGYDGTSFKH